jgi:hypothetical protein
MNQWVIIPKNPLVSFYLPSSNEISSKTNNKSFTISLVSRIQTFRLIQKELKKRQIDSWIPKSPAQKDFVYMLYSDAKGYEKWMSLGSGSTAFSLSYPLIKGTKVLISDNKNKTNNFLKDNGSKQEVKSDGNAVSILMNLNVKWLGITKITKIDNKFKGFKVSTEFDIYETRPYPWIHLIKLYTTDPNISVFIKMRKGTYYDTNNPYSNVKNIINERRQRRFFRKITKNFSGINRSSYK